MAVQKVEFKGEAKTFYVVSTQRLGKNHGTVFERVCVNKLERRRVGGVIFRVTLSLWLRDGYSSGRLVLLAARYIDPTATVHSSRNLLTCRKTLPILKLCWA